MAYQCLPDWKSNNIELKKFGDNTLIVNQCSRNFRVEKDDFIVKILKGLLLKDQKTLILLNALQRSNKELVTQIYNIFYHLDDDTNRNYLSNPNEKRIVYIEITNRCNLQCRYCYNDSNIMNYNNMTLDEINKIVEFINNNKNISLVISGGEPLLHPQFSNILDFIKKNKYDAMIYTNGVLLSKYIKELANSNIKLFVSLDGSSEIGHDYMRGTGNYNKTISGIEELLHAGFNSKHLNFSFIINNYNIKSIENMIDLSLHYKVNKAQFVSMNPRGRGKDLSKELFPSKENIIEMWYMLSEMNEKYPSLKIDCDVFWQRKVISIGKYMPGSCSICSKIRIDVSGNVFPCPFLDGNENIILNINECNLDRIFNNEKCERYLSILKEKSDIKIPCCNCIFRSFCQGGCIAKSYMAYNDFYAVDDECSARKQYYIKCLSEL